MNAQNSASILSGRAQDRMLQLQRALSAEMRSLVTQQSLLLGALQACDIGTQASHLQDYLERVNALLSAVARLRVFIERHTAATVSDGSEERLVQQPEFDR